MTTLSEGARQGDILRWELFHNFSRENVTVVATAALKIGTVLAQKTKSSVVAAKVAGGTGNGVIGACTLGALAIPGIYRIKFTKTGGTTSTDVVDTSANVIGTFATTTSSVADVISPTGELIGELTVGVAFASGHINLTVADGDADWTAGDEITVTVTGDNKYYPASYGAVDGTGEACAILLNDTAITAGATLAILRRYGILVPSDLIYDASYDSAPKKAVAVAQLKSISNILVVPAASYV